MIKDDIKKELQMAINKAGFDNIDFSIENTNDLTNGDYYSNVALIGSKKFNLKPRDLAEKIVANFKVKNIPLLSRIEMAGAGFINFYLDPNYFVENLHEIKKLGKDFGKNNSLSGKKVIIEFTDPNPFKEFHIGHLMSNTIGESVARLYEFANADLKRACYQGDVGLHVATTIWGILEHKKDFIAISKKGLVDKVAFLGKCYAYGASLRDKEIPKKAIQEINKKIFERSDKEINEIYDDGRQWSLDYFEIIYKRLGTKFDYYFFESDCSPFGKKVVEDGLKKNIFENSDGAVVWKGEEHGLHTRVFLNSQGLPTYEAKELGLANLKYSRFPYDLSIVITGNEINEYFKVLLSVMNLIFPDLAKKTVHLPHGMLRLPTGKMSSRTGDVITGESLLTAIEALVHQKIADREMMTDEKNKIADIVATSALKYSILRQAIGGNIIFDFNKSISFEGDSGPYLQYSYTRANSVIEKAKGSGISFDEVKEIPESVGNLERMLSRFPEIVDRARKENAPHQVATYLIELAGEFNSYYASNKIIASGEYENYRLLLTEAFSIIMKNGLYILGIEAPERM